MWEHARAAESRLLPAAGVLVQAVWFDAGGQRSGRLLLTIHHLAVDGVSWRILVPELAAAWSAVAGGAVPALTARGTSYRRGGPRLWRRGRGGAGGWGRLLLGWGLRAPPPLRVSGPLPP